MIRTHTVRLYPTPAQERTLLDWLACCRRLWNNFLEQRIKAYKRRGDSVSFYSQDARIASWRENDATMSACPFKPLRETARRLNRAFEAFFRRLKSGEKPGFPRFKSADRMRSVEFADLARYVVRGRIRVPCLGLIRCRNLRLADGTKAKSLRVLLRDGKWFAQLVIEDGAAAPVARKTCRSVGIDVGLASVAALSSGETIANPRHLIRQSEKIARRQRSLARTARGGRNRQKAKARLSRVHERVANCRKDFIHKLSKSLVERYDLIAVEKLNVQGMAKGRLAKSIHDASWGFLRHCLAYKAESAGVRYVEVDPRGTSQECSECGQIVKKDLSVRVHSCECGCVLDRDVNAARNILKRAAGRAVSACGGLALAGPVKQEGSQDSLPELGQSL